jgi:hypothetical protein
MNYIDKEELDKRLSSERNGSNIIVEHVPYYNGGRKKAEHKVDKILPIMKPVVGALAWTEGVNKTAEAFGITRQRVYELKNARSCHGVTDQDLKAKIDDIRREVSKTALQNTLAFMGLADPSKIEQEKLKIKDIIALAKDTSVIYKNMSSDSDAPKDNVAKVVIIAPSPKDPESYEIIDV